MTARARIPTVMGRMAEWRWFRNASARRAVFLTLAALCAILSLFPRYYDARVLLAPQDSLVAGSLLSPTPFDGDSAVLPGLPQPVDIELAIARSMDVAHVAQPQGSVTIRAIRAGIIEITVRDHQADRALATASRYADAVRARLAALREAQIEIRRNQLAARLAETGARSEAADAALAKAPTDRRRLAARDAARALHAGYVRALDSAAGDEQRADIRLVVLDRPAIDPTHRYNMGPAALLLLVLLLAAASEVYLIRPPRTGHRT